MRHQIWHNSHVAVAQRVCDHDSVRMTNNGKFSLRSAKVRLQSGRAYLVILGGILFAFSLRAAEPATITFSLDFPNSSPEHYSISVDSGGHAHYESSGKITITSDERDTYQTDFTFSDATRARIFELAAQAHYFAGKIDSGKKKLAF